jgi:surfactin synthase thioesterase subunit
MTHSTITSYRQARPQAKCQLFVLPHAGGSMTYYLPWQKILPESIELNLLQLPGRGTTFKEKPFTEWPEATQAVYEEIKKLIDDRPFAIFGHSLGALIGFEVAQKLQNKNLVHLFASGMSAPQHYTVPKLRYTLSDEELIKYVADTDDAMPHKDQNYFDYVKLTLPTIRADFQLVDTYEYHPKDLLQCSLSGMYGENDFLYSKESVFAWKEMAGKDFDFKTFMGGHMYLTPARQQVLEYLSNSLINAGP